MRTKRKILMSMLVIALAAALVGGATMAWFTDSDASTPTSFQAGTLLINIDEQGYTSTNPIDLDVLNPGDEWTYEFEIENTGTKDFIFTGMLFYDEILGNVNHTFPNEPRYANHGSKLLSEVLLMEASVGGNVFYTGTVAGYINKSVADGGHIRGDNPFHPEFEDDNPPIVFGEARLNDEDVSYPYSVKFTLPTSTGNDYQGSSMRLAFAVAARQWQDGSEYGTITNPLDGSQVWPVLP